MNLSTRDEFHSEVKLVLSQRAGLICSNPTCAVHTSGPRSENLKSISIGVASHITAASKGGPRYDPFLSAEQRASAANGIWLCQNCAKLIDNDPARFSVVILREWKTKSELDARYRLGKTTRSRTTEKGKIREIKRQQRLRDDLHKCLLKKPEVRMATINSGDRSRLAKFARSEVIIRNIEDESYPNQDDTETGISGWFRLEVMDFYSGGVEFVLDIQYVAYSDATRLWAPIPYRQEDMVLPFGLSRRKVFKVGRVPWRNILHCDLDGDQNYPQPHFFCRYADNEMPYENFAYYDIENRRPHDYEFELSPDAKTELSKLLALKGELEQ